LPRLGGEGDFAQGVGAAGVAEGDVAVLDPAATVADGDGPRGVADVDFLVQHAEGHLQVDEGVLQAADGGADRLQRVVDGGDVGQDDQEIAGLDPAGQDVRRPDPEHQGGAGGGGRVDRQREERLLDRQLDAGVDG